jgi:hypothetical protein
MAKRKFRYEDGGEVDALEAYNKGDNLDTTPGPRRDSEEVVDETGTASKFRRNAETGDLYSEERTKRSSAKSTVTPKPKAAAPASASAPAKTPDSSIPKGSEAAPDSTGKSTSGPSDVDRVLMGLGVGAGAAGVGRGIMSAYGKLSKARKAAAEAAEVAKRPRPVSPAKMTEDFTAGLSRARQQAKEKPAIEAARKATSKTKKDSPRAGSRYKEDEAGVEFSHGGRAYAKGGSVRGGGCESRGKTKGRFV